MQNSIEVKSLLLLGKSIDSMMTSSSCLVPHTAHGSEGRTQKHKSLDTQTVVHTRFSSLKTLFLKRRC